MENKKIVPGVDAPDDIEAQTKILTEWYKNIGKRQVHAKTAERAFKTYIKEHYEPVTVIKELQQAVISSNILKPVTPLFKEGWNGFTKAEDFEVGKPNPIKETFILRIKRFFRGIKLWLTSTN